MIFEKVIIFTFMDVRRITKDAILLALLCVVGMFSIPLGENIKVSFQLLVLFIIFGISDKLFDKILIPTLYLLLGLIAPIYAGFQAGITPTFGFVIGFVVSSIPFHFLYKNIKLNEYLRFIIASFVSLIVVYICGTIFMKFYLDFSLGKTLLIAVVPYIGFDLIKIAISTMTIKLLPTNIKTSSSRGTERDQ